MKKTIIFFLIAQFFLQVNSISCQNFPKAEWQKVDHPTFSGWDRNKLAEVQEYIIDSTATTGMMIIHDGKVIYEYGNVIENSYIASCRKSVLGMLYGKYVDNGTIDLDKTLEEVGTPYDQELLDVEKKATIRDIISSRSGIYLPASNPGDMSDLAPERGSVQPGRQWLYNNWDFNMAGYIFEKETQKNIYDEIEAQFAIPLQMQDWDRSIQEKSGDLTASDILAYHINFSARDMARLGVLMLNKGKWNGQQIISENWVAEMTSPSTTFEEVDKIASYVKNDQSQYSYGYMWWLWENPKTKLLEGSYSAQGAWGQNITIIPKLNTVIVIKTNDMYQRQKGDHNFIIDQIAQIYNPSLNAKLKPLAESLSKHDVKQFVKDYTASPPKSDEINFQSTLNSSGYFYLEKDIEKALAIFSLNVNQNPTAWNVYDSLAEAYFISNDYEKSLMYYQKALALNTSNQWNNNERVKRIIERLKRKI